MALFARRHLALCLLLLAIVECKPSEESSGSKESKSPNIIVILTEMTWNDIGYNNEDVITPVLDELAEHGVTLDSYYTYALSCASRANLFTGKHVTTLGLQTELIRPSRPFGMPLDTQTMADRLRQEDYSTHFIGKWHLGNFKKEFTPTYRGFDTFFGFHNGLKQHYDHKLPCPVNITDWGYDMWDSEGENLQTVRPQDMVGQYDTLLFRNRAVRNIDRHDKSKPLFMVVAPRDVMGNVDDVPQAYVDLYDDKSDHIELAMRKRFARATIVDDLVGEVVEALKFSNMWDNTVLAFMADKAEAVTPLGSKLVPYLTTEVTSMLGYYPEYRMHGISFVHSPLLGQERQGAHVSDLVHISDFFPTLLHAAGIKDVEDEADMYGKDMWPVISAGAPGTRQDILHFMNHGEPLPGVPLYADTFDTRIHACFRDGDLKLRTGHFSPWLKNYHLYNIADDPDELTDLSDSASYTSHVRNMLDKMQVYHLAAAPPLYFAPGNGPDPASCPRHHGGYFVPWR